MGGSELESSRLRIERVDRLSVAVTGLLKSGIRNKDGDLLAFWRGGEKRKKRLVCKGNTNLEKKKKKV